MNRVARRIALAVGSLSLVKILATIKSLLLSWRN
jgi:hypothetical protein